MRSAGRAAQRRNPPRFEVDDCRRGREFRADRNGQVWRGPAQRQGQQRVVVFGQRGYGASGGFGTPRQRHKYHVATDRKGRQGSARRVMRSAVGKPRVR